MSRQWIATQDIRSTRVKTWRKWKRSQSHLIWHRGSEMKVRSANSSWLHLIGLGRMCWEGTPEYIRPVQSIRCIQSHRYRKSSHPHLTLMYPPMYHPYRNLSRSFVWGHFTCKEPFRCKWSTIVCWSVRSNDTQEDDDILDAVVVDVWISSFFGNFTVVFGT